MKQKLLTWMVVLASAGTLGLLAPGCAWQIGGDKHGAVLLQATRGQELIDLKKARDAGAMTEEEYQEQRKKVMEH